MNKSTTLPVAAACVLACGPTVALACGPEAGEAYEKAIKLTAQGPARRFLEKRLHEVSG